MSIKVVGTLNDASPVMRSYPANVAIGGNIAAKFSSNKVVAIAAVGDNTSVYTAGAATEADQVINCYLHTPGLVLESTYSTGTPALGNRVEVNAGGAGVKAVTTGKEIGEVIKIIDASAKTVLIRTI